MVVATANGACARTPKPPDPGESIGLLANAIAARARRVDSMSGSRQSRVRAGFAGFAWHRAATPPSSTDLALAWRPYFDVCMELFGPHRCMFESNFPVNRSGCSYTVLWNAFKRLAGTLSVDERAALCAGTAQRIYRL